MTYTYDKLFLGSQWVEPTSSEILEISSPATTEVVGSCPLTTNDDVDTMVSAAREAFVKGTWSRSEVSFRAEVLTKAVDLMQEDIATGAAISSAEMGVPIQQATMVHLQPALNLFRYFAQTLPTEFTWEEVRPGTLGPSVVSYQPIGVVAAITAWNVPAFLNAGKLGPALLSGSSVVLKPSSSTPLTALWMADKLAQAGLPEGVLSIVTGPSSAGDHLVAHPEVNKVSFTGSTEVGKHVAKIAAGDLKRCTLELGGKSAAIVCEDADLGATAFSMLFSGMLNTGQACIAQTRILAPRSRYDEVVDTLTSLVSAWPVGDPSNEATQFGPLANHKQQQIVLDYIAKGKAEGARVAFGGEELDLPEALAKGAFVPPTIFADVDNKMSIAQEEIFGPVLCVIAYDTIEQAIEIANDSPYGLAGAVYSTDANQALEIAQRLETGTVGINFYAFDEGSPFGGFKASGIGRENGPEGLKSYCEMQSVMMPYGWEPSA